MYRFEAIRHVHLEPTTLCNARCPMCARNARGATLAGLDMVELSLEDVRTIFPREFCAQLEGFDLCGAYGDPAAARDLIEIAAYVSSASANCRITIYSNGGLRTPKWWKRLALEAGGNATVVFAIDGLADTNAIHRQDVVFDKVMDNARAFIDAGGRARWEFLVFRHNEHQVEAARELSVQMGFAEFSMKKSARFLEGEYDYVPEMSDGDLTHFPIHDRDGAVVAHLQPPQADEMTNATLLHYAQLIRHHGSLDALFARTPIHCRVLDTNSVFVSSRGHAFPCCWTYVQATRPDLGRFPAQSDRQVTRLVDDTGGFAQLDTRRRGLRAAVESRFFAAVEASWSCASTAAGRLRVCARACGTEFPAYFDQFHDPGLLPRSLQPLAERGTGPKDDLRAVAACEAR